MSKSWSRYFNRRCEHPDTVTVRSVGVERIVCENCAHVSFSIAPNLLFSHELVPLHDQTVELPKVSGL